MSLIHFEERSLSESVFLGSPEILHRRNVLYVPNIDGGADTAFGLYDENGRQILGNALFHGVPQSLKTQKVRAPFLPSAFRPKIDKAIYGGCLSDHYGHFITECFNTLWYYILHGNPDDRIIFHSHLNIEELYSRPWIVEFLKYADIRREQIIIPQNPVTITQLIVPGQAFSEDGFVYEVYASACRKVGNIAVQNAHSLPDGPLYFSRHKIKHGTFKIINEDILVDELLKHGVQTFCPEEHSVATQIAALQRPAIGPVGSAFHASIFNAKTRAVILCTAAGPRRSYLLMDEVHDTNMDYIWETETRICTPPANFIYAIEISNPEKTAKDLLHILDTQEKQHINKEIFLPTNQPPEIYLLQTKTEKPIVLHRPSEQMFARHPLKHDVEIIAIKIGFYIFLVAAHDEAPLLTITQPDEASPVLAYTLEQAGEAIALRNLRTKLWLKAPPPETGLRLHGDGQNIQEWELYKLVPHKKPDCSGRLAEILAGLSRLALTGDVSDISHDYPILAPALQEFMPSPRT
ncbi:MAG: glycosyltransferase family 61 protein [Acetobacter sp.]|nr:glycosyltransferase family 61 protein [Acetobacter sp.]MCH4061791.1 glycosyltransferase family 61 protein [Acetobacter sp.]MCH4089360.1 glycosyltransferase family 61 protein [Acetobacter sp.]MCI1294162.1 glycosyltransferase family 61 protein [Acetobacter sp.]MCI1320747.1 glycosyltransferase family 61 protein [Acetobacter sp.]